MKRLVYMIGMWLMLAGAGLAEPAAGLRLAMVARTGHPLPGLARDDTTRHGSASLFVEQANGGLFAALPGPAPLLRAENGTVAARLRDLIARAEAGPAGYDAVQGGAHRPPPRRPTRMTLRDIFNWIDATPGQHHAIGRYQIIPATLRRLVARAGLDPGTRYSPAVQDWLADMLLEDAGLNAVHRGEMTREVFRLNLAKIWAGLPTPSGRSYYHGVAGNRAVIGYASYARAVDAILGG